MTQRAVSSTLGRLVAPGDVNAFFGLVLDNVGNLILMASLLIGVFQFPAEFVLSRMIPGTAVGVLVGDLMYSVLAVRLARRTGRADVTAMPLGLDTPSMFGMVFLVMGPAFVVAKQQGITEELAAEHAWYVGVGITFLTGIFKVAVAPVCGWIRRAVPRAGLLGSLAAIGLVFISFQPLLEVLACPIPGLVTLAIVLATLTARWRLPGGVPGALVAVAVGGIVYMILDQVGMTPTEKAFKAPNTGFALPLPWTGWSTWVGQHWAELLGYVPIAFPFALATVVGGIDCVESATAAGDEYPTGWVIAGEGVATLAGAIFGGVIQTTPYIGHPAYKRMGGRVGYTVGTALFVGGVGLFGLVGPAFALLPKCIIFPILVFIGLEIAAQSFAATPRRHYPAVVFGFIPVVAYLVLIEVNQLVSGLQIPFSKLPSANQTSLQTLTVLANGFLITSLLWTTLVVRLIDGRAVAGAIVAVAAAMLSAVGVMHSPLSSSAIGWPDQLIQRATEEGRIAAAPQLTPWTMAAAYLGVAACLIVLGRVGKPETETEDVKAQGE
ncbi:permease [Fimbriiglobus ruber]|uniref:Transport facilitation n=1 Tax=Fimbriiglobus ruber TaxID=1908690 RepID=A0A225D8C0_9BACT|nr:permease [Fimbriiglobus ruber]OWK37702.1 transport facilitation [Fimbriiglobus ruber]